MRIDLRHGDCVERMAEMDAESVEVIVCDPPYGLKFMGKEFDDLGEGAKQREWHVQWLREAFRVVAPGGTIKAFGGSRTFHHLAAAMEQVGFVLVPKNELEAWTYGSGFPKSMSVSKALDKQSGVDASQHQAVQDYLRERREAKGLSKAEVDKAVFGGTTRYTWVEGRGGKRSSEVYLPTPEEWVELKEVLDLDGRFDAYIKAAIPSREDRFRADGGKAKQVGTEPGDWGYQQSGDRWDGERRITEPASAAAKRWEGWGTAIKPAWEPVLVARKPGPGLDLTVTGKEPTADR